MEKIGITEYFDKINFAYPLIIDEITRIGDVTAIREKNGITYRRNYERGFLMVALAKHYNLKKFLEFGTGRGFATACLLRLANMESVTTIDKQSTDEAKNLIRSLGIDDIIANYIKAEANSISEDAIGDGFDLVFIDAQHDGKSVGLNYDYAKNKMADRSIVVFDDYRKKFMSVKQMVDSIPFKYKLLVHTDGWIVENVFIKKANDADKVKRNREYKSGMVVCSNSIKLI